MQKKGHCFFSVSVVVFTNSVPNFGGGLKIWLFCWKHYKHCDFGICWKRKMVKHCQTCWAKTWSKVKSKLGPSMLRNIIGPSFDSKNGKYVFICLSHLPAERKVFLKKTGNEEANSDQVLTLKRPFLDQVLTLQHACIYTSIYIYMNVYVLIYAYMLWSYYLGQVWPVWVLLSWPSLFWTLFVKQHYTKRGFGTFFCKSSRSRAHFSDVIIWAKLATFTLQLTWPR